MESEWNCTVFPSTFVHINREERKISQKRWPTKKLNYITLSDILCYGQVYLYLH